MRPATILALTIASFGVLPLACTQNFDYFATTQGTGGGTTSSTSSTSSTGMASSSSSGGTKCTGDKDCNDQNDCTTDTCNTSTGKCSNVAVPDGPPPGYTDTTPDCKTQTCMAGVNTTVNSDSDVPPSTNQCVKNSCSGGMVQMSDVAAGMACGTGQVCDGAGNCGCSKTSDCGQAAPCNDVACNNMKCVVTPQGAGATCSAGGGKVCDGAGMCVGCNDGGDCSSGNCQANHTCGLALDGHACQNGGQCNSSHCVAGICCDHTCGGNCQACTAALTGGADGTCGNIKAGTTAPSGQCAAATCGNDGKCDGSGGCEQIASGTQCATAKCVGNSYVPAQVCASMACPSGGTGTDCGNYKCTTAGNSCPSSCTMNSQCTGTNVCLPGATGTCGAPLADGATCTDGSQCMSTFCYGTPKVCQPNSCGDGVKDGDETDIDCGGSCPACTMSGQHCLQPSDCASPLNCNAGSHKCL